MKAGKRQEAAAFWLGVILIGCLIQAAGWAKNDRLVFPGTGEILRSLGRLLSEAKTWRMIRTTFVHLAEALALASAAGIAIGLAEGISGFVRNLLKPLMTFMRSIPMIVLAVVVMVLMKYDRVPLACTTLTLIPLISEAACEGLRRIDPELLDVYRLNSRLNLTVIRRVYLPLMAGYLRQGYVNAVGMGLKMTVSTEYLVQTRDSLGKAIYTSSYFNEYAEIYAYALIMILLVVAVSRLPEGIRRIRMTAAAREKTAENGGSNLT